MPDIYCIEGHWDYEDREPSVEPMLEMIQSVAGWRYIRRNSATVDEMRFWLNTEWWDNCPDGSILYIASHGGPGEVCLSTGQTVAISELPEGFAQSCLVHFSGCQTLDISPKDLSHFLGHSGAAAVSGYTKDAGWLTVYQDRHGVVPPCLALEAMYFTSALEVRLDLLDGDARARIDRVEHLRNLEKDLRKRFPECGFRLHIAED